MILYHCVDARSFRVLWALEELELDYDLRILPFPPRALEPGYREINPLGTVPFLIDGVVRMTESAAILDYLASRHGRDRLRIAPDAPDYGAYLQYLHFGESTLTSPLSIILRYAFLESAERQCPQIVEDYKLWFSRRAATLAPHLAQVRYLCGDRLTAADISVGYALMFADRLRLLDSLDGSIRAYLDRLRRTRGYIAATGRQQPS